MHRRCRLPAGIGGQANLPPFVTLNVKEKALFSGLFGGQGLFSPGDVYEDETVLILHGRHGLLTWTAVVAKDTGQMSMSISHLGKTFAQFGSCTPQSVGGRRRRLESRARPAFLLSRSGAVEVPVCSKSVDNGDDANRQALRLDQRRTVHR